jgi:Uma2 family endonuclease
MAEVGILTEDDRVQLIRGEIIDMPPIGPGHAGSVEGFGDALRSAFGEAASVRTQNPVRLASGSEPEPDLAVVRPRDDYYRSGHPVAADVYLVVEIADSTLTYDRVTKAHLYAEDSIPEYWLVNLIDDEILVHRDPSPTGYRTIRACKRGDTIRPMAFPDIGIAVSDVLRPRA